MFSHVGYVYHWWVSTAPHPTCVLLYCKSHITTLNHFAGSHNMSFPTCHKILFIMCCRVLCWHTSINNAVVKNFPLILRIDSLWIIGLTPITECHTCLFTMNPVPPLTQCHKCKTVFPRVSPRISANPHHLLQCYYSWVVCCLLIQYHSKCSCVIQKHIPTTYIQVFICVIPNCFLFEMLGCFLTVQFHFPVVL